MNERTCCACPDAISDDSRFGVMRTEFANSLSWRIGCKNRSSAGQEGVAFCAREKMAGGKCVGISIGIASYSYSCSPKTQTQ